MIKIIKLANSKLNESKYDTIAFWMKGREVFETDVHIEAIIKEPFKFDISIEEIENIYKKHNERIGVEGKAREEIIKLIAEKGWIRIRHYVRPVDYWSIQFDQYFKRKKQVEYFIDWALKKAIMKSDDAITLIGYDDHHVQSYSTPEGGVSKIFWEHKLRSK